MRELLIAIRLEAAFADSPEAWALRTRDYSGHWSTQRIYRTDWYERRRCRFVSKTLRRIAPELAIAIGWAAFAKANGIDDDARPSERVRFFRTMQPYIA